jgi:hypothetical protein
MLRIDLTGKLAVITGSSGVRSADDLPSRGGAQVVGIDRNSDGTRQRGSLRPGLMIERRKDAVAAYSGLVRAHDGR